MELLLHFEGVDPFFVNEDLVASVFERIISDYGFISGALSVVFCSDEFILQTNRDYLNHDYYTDIITFDYTEHNVISGDMIVSVDTVKSNAVLYSVDFLTELLRVCIHGVLHLVGLKDKTEPESVLMREQESFYLSSSVNPFVPREL